MRTLTRTLYNVGIMKLDLTSVNMEEQCLLV